MWQNEQKIKEKLKNGDDGSIGASCMCNVRVACRVTAYLIYRINRF